MIWMCVFFCFKQKTAYEMRISDWSSDVCSSDLLEEIENGGRGAGPVVEPNRWQFVPRFPGRLELFKFGAMAPVISTQQAAPATDHLILVSRIESDAKRKGRRVCDIATHSRDRKSTRLNSSH